MNRITMFSAVLVIASAFGAAQAPSTQPSNGAAASGESLLTNGGFEQKLEGWDASKDGGMSTAKPEAAHTGEMGLRVDDSDDVKGASFGCVLVPSAPGRTYEVRFWGRLMSGKNGFVHIQFADAKRKTLNKKDTGNEIRASIKGDDWKEYKMEGTAPPDTAFVRVWIHSQNTGKAMFDVDDIVLREVK